MLKIELAASLPGHQNPIYTVEASQKPGIIFTAGNDKGVVEWSIKRNEFIKVLLPVKTSVYALHAPSFAPLLAVGERSGVVSLFDFGSQKIIAELKHHTKPVFDLSSVNSKKELLVSSEDGSVSVWDLDCEKSAEAQFKLLYHFRVSGEMVRVMSISNDEKLVAFGCKDNFIRIFSLEDYSLQQEINAHSLPVTALAFSPDGRYLLSGSRDAQIKIWNTRNFTLYKSVPAHLFAIYGLAFHPRKALFASASRDKTIKIWNLDFELQKTISLEKGYDAHRLSVNKIIWEANNDRLISVSDDKLVKVWDVLTDV